MGIDGCRGGWICITLQKSAEYQWHIVSTAGSLVDLIASRKLSLIDIPIGLVGPGNQERRCDREARKVLGMPRAASVFSPPARATLEADNYDKALIVNRRQTRKGISKQAWNITPKIREVDWLIRSNPGLKGKLRECHPEVCFWALNGKTPMGYNKKTTEGCEERLSVLAGYVPQASSIVESIARQLPRRVLAMDDIVDALVLAVTARLGYGKLVTLPANPPLDEIGLSMEIVYADDSR